MYASDPALAGLVGAAVEGAKEEEDDDEEIPSSPEPAQSDEDPEEEEDDEEEATPAPASKAKKGKRKWDAEQLIAKRHSAYRDYRVHKCRDTTLQKWFHKTRLAGARSKGLNSLEVDVVQQIHQIMKNESRLVQRTQTKRSEYAIIGRDPLPEEPEAEAEIFDDDDFYQELLREVIERKAASTDDPTALARRYVELQKLRGKLGRKKAVDTKASKGRKVRFLPLPKLVGLMGSVDPEALPNAWSDQAKDQLFPSLFGQTPKPPK